jgi:mRNA-degrading endonuclease RelE of RelBE toxin-antitoxin system
MEFRISDTFVDSLAKLSNQEQKAVKTTVSDLQVNPASPGLSFHKLDWAYGACTRARDHLLVTCVKPASEFLDDMRM